MRVYEVVKGSTSFDGLRAAEREKPVPGPGEVLVKMRAASLNYRDLAIVTGNYFSGPVDRDTIVLSDGAGEIEAVGEGVSTFAAGDRVTASFSQPPGRMPLGSPLDGCLTEYACFAADGLVRIPSHLDFQAAAALPCAGVTAWNALTLGRPVKAGDTVLTLGTGGVSVLALQLARAAGARVIVTSSSDEKLERARALGANDTINYRSTPDWADAVLELTAGAGADQIVEVGGFGTLPLSYRAVGEGGEIAMIGVLSAPDGDLSPHPLMRKSATLRGVFVGKSPTSEFEKLNRALEVNAIRPVIDRTFSFDESVEAYRYLADARHFGKVVIEI